MKLFSKIYLNKNVFDAAIERLRYLFDEFENVVISFSGGKDSTVLLNLALRVAEEKNRLPLPVQFLDQEGEWECVIDYIREVMNDKRVKPFWFQIPFRIFNAASNSEQWLHCWEEGKQWLRDKEDISIKENVYGTDRFKELLDKTIEYHFSGKKTSVLTGVRCEESPGRFKGLTIGATYKHITYGRKTGLKKGYYTFCPLYDWSYTDIWKAIHDNKWKYCRLYDYMYQYGISPVKMRVSNITHETAITDLYFLQEIEPETWVKLTKRLSGINTVGQLNKFFNHVKELPYMFKSWIEYRDYLLENLITDKEHREIFRKQFKEYEGAFREDIQEKLVKTQVNMILVNDYHKTKLKTFSARYNKEYIKVNERTADR